MEIYKNSGISGNVEYCSMFACYLKQALENAG